MHAIGFSIQKVNEDHPSGERLSEMQPMFGKDTYLMLPRVIVNLAHYHPPELLPFGLCARCFLQDRCDVCRETAFSGGYRKPFFALTLASQCSGSVVGDISRRLASCSPQ